MGEQVWRPYSLPRDASESQRLNLQHRLLLENTGFLLHPRIAATLPQDAHVAEIATGTGVWLEDLASTCPSTWKLTGFDLSDAQFPPAEKQKRVQLDVLDILQPVPENWKNTFDVVHIRYLILGLTGKDWHTVARNSFDLLKPGGWIQWQEANGAEARVVQNVPGAPRGHLERCFKLVHEANFAYGKMLPRDVCGRVGIVEAEGFQDGMDDIISVDRVPGTRAAWVETMARSLASIMRMCARQDASLGWTEEMIDALHAGSLEEIKDDRVYLVYPFFITTAKKPLVIVK